MIFATHAKHLDSDPQDDFRDEVRSYFGTGTQLQEMYITPQLLRDGDWDTIAECARWSRAHAGTLADSHWVGGDPARLEPYGWAAWSPQRCDADAAEPERARPDDRHRRRARVRAAGRCAHDAHDAEPVAHRPPPRARDIARRRGARHNTRGLRSPHAHDRHALTARPPRRRRCTSPRSTSRSSSRRSSSPSCRRSCSQRASRSTTEFFTSGRAAPWWLIGVSMVATTFSTDTPNLVTNLVREHGVADNWLWWAFLLTGMSTVFFYARLWRRLGRADRSRVLRDSAIPGKPATFVRGFRAIYLGLFFNCVIMATVNLAAAKIGNVLLGWPMARTLLVCGRDHDLLRVDVGAVGRARDRLHPVRHHDDRHVRGGVLRAASSRRSAACAGCSRRSIRKTLPLLPDFGDWSTARRGLHHPAHGAVVVGVVSRRGTRRRQLHRAAHARGQEREGCAGRHALLQRRCTTRCARGRGSSSRSRRCSSSRSSSDIARALPVRGPVAASATTWRIPAMLTLPARGIPRPDGRRTCSPRISRRSRRTSTGARRIWCTTSTGVSSSRTRASATTCWSAGWSRRS